MSIAKAKEVITIEANAIKALTKKINRNFMRAVDLVAKCKGRVVVSGIGKAGIIGNKIAATFSSTGTPSIFLHSADAVHGDLGQVTKEDVLILLSNSGETEETKRIIPLIKKIGCPCIAMTGNVRSNVAKFSDVVIDVSVAKEGCPLGLAPMASTTAMLVMGDALAACLILRKKFKKEDFAFYHPGGSLGRQLLLKVEDIMRKGAHMAKVKKDAKVKNVLLAITKARCGSACVLSKKGTFVGIFTDGDLRRHIESEKDLLNRPVAKVMTKHPATVNKDALAAEALAILKDKKIDELPVVDKQGKLVGLLDIQDCLKAGLV